MPPRFRVPALALVGLLLVPRPTQAIPRVSYRVSESVGSWQPLAPGDLAETIEHAALEVLSRPGTMQLERHSAKAPPADYELYLTGRILDEAETHTVYIRLEPGPRSGAGSLSAADTVELRGAPRAEMVRRVEASARRAADRIAALIGPTLAAPSASPALDTPPATLPELPFQWPKVRIPKSDQSRAARDLYAKDNALRRAALRELTSLALTETAPRQTLEACALQHFDDGIRLGCLVALRPLSRRTAPTQRVVVDVFRSAKDRQELEEAVNQMLFFTGLARADAVQAWLERAAKGEVWGALDQLGDLPNLDLAIERCLLASAERPKYQRSKRACIELLEPVPVGRRRKILGPHLAAVDPDSPYFLEGAGEREGSIGTDWQWAVEAVLDGARTFDPELTELLWRRYQRTLSSSAIDVLSEVAPPSADLTDKMLELIQTAGARQGLTGLRRIAADLPDQRAKIREKLAELLHTRNYPKTLSADALESLIAELKEEHR